MHVESAGRQILSDESDGVENVTPTDMHYVSTRKQKKVKNSDTI